ncbi:Peptidase S33 tripeptidyl aminopeptidase-lik [Cordyceps fumosorosea ARSEF 2679]|uniref:Peptidase S33 tripeptidyl aminopeptidase-lik n=1 Tax=Cordyceps fumosorosea (strain ARSEF 2679) TaxID=1081104 RepID=A0A168ELD3_CORFA|nr:Peptidase S33 tripeptidyl aminopeptidase-lik [Cordyceps fumosorosea ARSEF 2679]OAA73945.1 Peptidase S33 tripeptidyl aminopeptidase-lik [Cordyceps fumosorosea ARSEF 2679]
MRYVTAAGVAASLAGALAQQVAAAAAGPASSSSSSSSSFDWDRLPPSTVLSYRPCYDGYECARLTAPMDWLNATSDPRVVVLALIRLPAVVPASDPTFGGTVITNPGGPGGSRLRETLDVPGRRHYEILSFDPRGVGSSWPRADCLPGDDLARDAFAYEERGVGVVEGDAVPRLLGLYRSFLGRCAEGDKEGKPGAEIMGYMSTPSVARDMVHIVDKIDEHLKAEGVNVQQEEEGEADGEEDRLELRKRGHGHKKDAPRLQYVGYSYGTVLGNYFASLFPERVGRLILDGVVDAEDYSSGPGWLTSTVDADNITSHFYSGCHSAGPSACPLAQPSDTSGAAIEARVESFIASLADAPLPITIPSGSGSGSGGGGGFSALTPADVRVAAAISSYAPGRTFRPLASALAALLAGNATSFVALLDNMGAFPHLRDACAAPHPGAPAVPVMQLTVNEASIATRCADGEDVAGRDPDWWRDFVTAQRRASRTFGGFWSKIRLPCAGFRFPRHWAFKGPFTTPRAGRGRDPKRPAAPLLFLSSRLDPVTPLRSARRMAAMHPGAALVVQESMGHCALASARSECTARVAREYMHTGKVPKARETVCESDFDPWKEEKEGEAEAALVIDTPRFLF